MSRSLIQTASQSSFNIDTGNTIPLGSVLRRYGCNCRLNGDSIEVVGCGYYKVSGTVTLTPTEIGNISVALYQNGVVVPGTTVTGSVAVINDSVTLPIITTIRLTNDEIPSQLSLVVTENATSGSRVSMRVEKS